MKNKIIILFIYIICILLFLEDYSILNASQNNNLLVGVVKLNITPQSPVPIIPFSAREGKPFTGVHDDLFVRCILFNDGENKAIIITADIIIIPEILWEETTSEIQSKTGIPKENIMLCATHTHSGPKIRQYNNVSNRNDSLSINTNKYFNNLKKQIVNTAIKANRNLKPVTIGFGIGKCLMNINRRVSDMEDKIRFGNNPYGAVDHDVTVIRIDDRLSNPIAVFFNWPCHASVLGGTNFLISGDWHGITAQYVEKNFKDNIIVLPTAGASADVNSITSSEGNFISYKRLFMDVLVKDLGNKVIKTIENINICLDGSISSSQRVIKLPGKEDTDIKIRLSMLKIGSIIFAGVSGELFTEIGLKVKELSSYKNICIITHCNGSSGYIVTDKAYDEGGYEVEATRIKSGAEKAIINNLVNMINNI